MEDILLLASKVHVTKWARCCQVYVACDRI